MITALQGPNRERKVEDEHHGNQQTVPQGGNDISLRFKNGKYQKGTSVGQTLLS